MTIEHKWLTYDEINKVDVNSSQKDSEDSSILEIYLYYPKNLNDLHNECLLLPEKIQSIENMLPNSCKKHNNNKTMQYFRYNISMQ